MDGYFNLFASILLCACVSVLLFPDYFENSHICVFGWNVFFVFFISDFYYRVLVGFITIPTLKNNVEKLICLRIKLDSLFQHRFLDL